MSIHGFGPDGFDDHAEADVEGSWAVPEGELDPDVGHQVDHEADWWLDDPLSGGDHAVEPSGAPDPDWAQDAGFWHEQQGRYSCAVAAQEDVLEQVTGLDFEESQLAGEAAAQGWYDPGAGTPMDHVGDLIEAHGLHTVRGEATLEQLESLVEQDVPVIVPVDSEQLWAAAGGGGAMAEAPVVVGGGANHVVVVTGFDLSDPRHPQVVLNDSGRSDGGGLHVDLDRFQQAWADAGNYVVYPDGTASTPQTWPADGETDLAAGVGATPYEPMVGTSWTVEGTTEDGHPVEYSTSYSGYYDEVTGEKVVEK